jgi:hypothetical protein
VVHDTIATDRIARRTSGSRRRETQPSDFDEGNVKAALNSTKRRQRSHGAGSMNNAQHCKCLSSRPSTGHGRPPVSLRQLCSKGPFTLRAVPRGAGRCRTHKPRQFWFVRHVASFSPHYAATVRKTPSGAAAKESTNHITKCRMTPDNAASVRADARHIALAAAAPRGAERAV